MIEGEVPRGAGWCRQGGPGVSFIAVIDVVVYVVDIVACVRTNEQQASGGGCRLCATSFLKPLSINLGHDRNFNKSSS